MSVSAERRVELAREGIEAYDAGDLETALARFSPEIEVYSPPGTVNVGTYHGLEGFLKWTQLWDEAWERFDREVEDTEAIGERHVVAIVRHRGVGRGSGVAVEQLSGYVFDLDPDERCVYFALYNEPDEAFAAAREREGIA